MDEEKQFGNPRLKALFNQSIYGIAIFDRDGKYLEVNKAWETIFQNELKEFEDYSLFKDPQVVSKGLITYIEAGYAGKSVKVPPFLYDPAEIGFYGKPRWLEISINPVKDKSGLVCELAMILKDITEQALAQKKLEQNEWKLRNLIKLVPMLIWTANCEGLIEYFNDQWKYFIDFQDISTNKWKELIHPDDRDSMLKRIAYAIKTGTQYEYLHRLKRKDGQYRWLLGKAIPIKDVNGLVIKWFGASTDLTDMLVFPHQQEEIS